MNQRHNHNKLLVFNEHVHQAILKIVEPQLPLELIARAHRLNARFKCTYWDKAFGAVEVFRYLRACHIAYVIALAKHGGVHGIGQLCVGRSSRHARYTFNQSLVNLYVLFRATWTHVTCYGKRVCHHCLTLDDVASALQQEVQRTLGFAPEFHYRV